MRRTGWAAMGWISGAVAACAAETASPGWVTPACADQPARRVLAVAASDRVVLEVGELAVPVRLLGVRRFEHSPAAAARATAFCENLLKGERVYVFQPGKWEAADRQAETGGGAGDSGADPDNADEARPAFEAFEPGRGGASGYPPVEVLLFRAPDGLFINLEIVRQGYARREPGAKRPYAPVFAYYETLAERHQRGLWAPAEGVESDQPVAGQGGSEGTPGAQKPESPVAEEVVYVTPHGTRYHRQDCSYVRDGGVAITLAEARERELKPCTRCRPPEAPSGEK
jgi:endonuclease YncB( thermonuclease family)